MKIFRIAPIKNQLLSKIQGVFLWAMTICPLPADFWRAEVFKLPIDQPELALLMPVQSLDTPRREKLAQILAATPTAKLCVDLAETQAAQVACSKIELSKEQKLQRARVLSQWNRNEAVLETLAQIEPLDCEATYLKGLSYRRLRNYVEANLVLKKADMLCEDDFKKKALFVRARLAAMRPSESAEIFLNEFIQAYPQDRYTDDVLLWKAHTVLELGKKDLYFEVLDKILKEYSNGDMRDLALFESAWAWAGDGQPEKALAILENLDTAQSLYWQGRLRMYPDPKKLLPHPNKTQFKQGKKILRDLAESRPFDYYGHFAAQLSGFKSKLKPPSLRILKSQLLQKDPVYAVFECLKKNKNPEEAIWVLDRLVQNYQLFPERAVLAKAYLDLERPDKSHQLMRALGLAFPAFKLPEEGNYPWQLAFPVAYLKVFQKAAIREKIDQNWLMGLCREESMFDKDIVSWAGAVGLCQLLPSTAGLPLEALLNPEINIESAASHLKDVRKVLQHPLEIIAAYNAGQTAVLKWSKKYPEVPMDYFIEQIPYEQTRNYVKKVSSAWLSYAWLSGHLKKKLYEL